MKNNFKCLILGLLIALSSCNIDAIEGSAKMINKDYDISNFENISTKNTFDVTIVQSDKYKVELECNENLEQFLEVSKDNKTLILSLQGNHNYYNTTCKAIVHTPNVNLIEVKGISKVNIPDFNSEVLTIQSAGSTKILGNLEVKNLLINCKGSSKVNLTGNVSTGEIYTAGASKIDAGNLTFGKLVVSSDGASKIKVNVKDELQVNLSGASKFEYHGNPKILNQELNGVGKIKRLD